MAGAINKCIKSVVISDPDSPCQVVNLRPLQPFKLKLSPAFANEKVTLRSQYLKVNGVTESQHTVYDIVQVPEAVGLNMCSTFHLGEVQVGDRGKLLLYLDNDTELYKNTLTVLAPNSDTIRIKPFQMLEVVLLSEGMPQWEDRWKWDWEPARYGVDIGEIGHRYIYSSYLADSHIQSHPFNMVGYMPSDTNYMQHHFWFRCEREVLGLLPKIVQRGFYMGKLIFKQGSSAFGSTVDVFVDLHHRYYDATVAFMKGPGPTPHQAKSFAGPVCRSVSLQEISGKSWDEGCRTVGGEDAALLGTKVDNLPID